MKFFRFRINQFRLFLSFFIFSSLISCNQNQTENQNKSSNDSSTSIPNTNNGSNLDNIDTKFDILYLTNQQLKNLQASPRKHKFIFQFFHKKSYNQLTLAVWTADKLNQNIDLKEVLYHVTGPTYYTLDISNRDVNYWI